MLLYAIYVPDKQNVQLGKYRRVYAFASVERLVLASRLVDDCRTGKIEIITKADAKVLNETCPIRLYTGSDFNCVPKIDGLQVIVFEDDVVYLNKAGNTLRDSKMYPVKISLSETIAGERIPRGAAEAHN